MSVQPDQKVVKSKITNASKQSAKALQFTINLDKMSSSTANASKLLEIFSQQSKQDAALPLSEKIITTVPSSNHSVIESPVIVEETMKTSNSSQATATFTGTSMLTVAGDSKAPESTVLQASKKRKTSQVLSLLSSDTDTTNLQVKKKLERKEATVEGQNLNSCGGNGPLVTQSTHSVVSKNNVVVGPNQAQLNPLLGQHFLLMGSQNLYRFVTLQGNSGKNGDFRLQSVAKTPPQRPLVPMASTVPSGCTGDSHSRPNQSNPPISGLQSGAVKQLIAVSSQSGSRNTNLSAAQRLLQPRMKTTNQQGLNTESQVSVTCRPSAVESNNRAVADATPQLVPSSTTSLNRISLDGSKQSLNAYVDSIPVLPTTSSASINLSSSGVPIALAPGHVQTGVVKKTPVIIFSNQSTFSTKASQVKCIASSTKNLIAFNAAPSLLACAPQVTHPGSCVIGDHSVSVSTSPLVSNLNPTLSRNSPTLQQHSGNTPTTNSSCFYNLVSANSLESTNLKSVKNSKEKTQPRSLLNPQIVSSESSTNSSPPVNSEKSTVRPIQPKHDSVVFPFNDTSKLMSETSKVSKSQNNTSFQLNKLVISDKSLLNLNKILQKVNIVPKDVSNMAAGNTQKSISNPSSITRVVPVPTQNTSTYSNVSLSKLDNARFQLQASLSKNTRLSTASIPRRSYLQMLRDDSPKERGSFSLISNKKVNLNKDLKQKSVSLGSSTVSNAGPVFLTTTLRTVSGPVSVKVRTPSVDVNSETLSTVLHTPTQLDAIGIEHLHAASDKNTSQNKGKILDESKISDRTLHKSRNNSSVLPSVAQDDDSSDSDLEFLQDSEEQDMRVLTQLLQQSRPQITESQGAERRDINVSNTSCGTTTISASSISTLQSDKDCDVSVCKNNISMKHQCPSSSSLVQGKLDTDSGTQDLRISSVFSLNPTCQLVDGESAEVNVKEMVAYNSEVKWSENSFNISKASELCCNSSENVIPCFCVLDRLSEEYIKNPDETGSRCSEYCRKRSLSIMCNLDLLPCSCKTKSTIVLDEQIKSRQNDFNDADEEKLSHENYRQVKEINFQNKQSVHQIEEHGVLDSSLITQGSSRNRFMEGLIFPKQKDTTQRTQSDSQLVFMDKTSLPSKDFGTAFKSGSDVCVTSSEPLTSFPQHKLRNKEHASLNSSKQTSSQSLVFEQAVMNLRKQIDKKRRQMHKHKQVSKSKQGWTVGKISPDCLKSLCEKIQVTKPPVTASKPVSKKSENEKSLVLSRTNKPIVATLLPPDSVRSQETASCKNDTKDSDVILPTHNPLKKHSILTPNLRPSLPQPISSPAQNIQWSAKITQALKSLHLYLQSTGKPLNKTERHHFLLRIGEQHVLVSIPPTETSGESSKAEMKGKSNAVPSTATVTPHVTLHCKRSAEMVSAEAEHNQKADYLGCQKTFQAVRTIPAEKNILNPNVCETTQSLSGATDKNIIHPQSSFSHSMYTEKVTETSATHTVSATAINPNKKRECLVSQAQSQASSEMSVNSFDKRPHIYADPSSILSHLPLDSTLLPTPNRNAQNYLSKEKQASKRAMLEKKYPLPPGVIIKVEPDVSCDYDTSSLGHDKTKQASSSSPVRSYEKQISTSQAISCTNPLLASSSHRKNNAYLFSDSETDTCGENDEYVDMSRLDENCTSGETNLSIICSADSPDEPPSLISEAPIKKQQRRKRSRKRTSTIRACGSNVNTEEQPPVLAAQYTFPVNQATYKFTSSSISSSEESILPACYSGEGESGNPPKRQRKNPEENVSMSDVSSSISLSPQTSQNSPKQGFKATDVSVSKNIRIQRLKELLKKKEQEIEAMKKIRLELPSFT